MAFPLLAILLLGAIFHADAKIGSGLPRRLKPAEHHERFLHQATIRRLAAADAQKNEGKVFYPIAYGADPNGTQDSTTAIGAALNDAFHSQVGRNLMPSVNDLGGVVVDLQGGNYVISQPLRFPNGVGNLVIQGGSLRASENFPTNGYLIELLPEKSSGNILYEDITFRDILFDATYRGGGLIIVDSVRIRVDNCFFIHFNTTGITVKGGHETFISSCFLGQHITAGGNKNERDFSGTAIELDGNDNAITDVAIFSAAIGVTLRGQANMITGVHCYNKATFFGGIGILVKLAGLGQTRIDNCYLDYTGIEIEDPVQVHVTNAFFLGDASILLRSVKGLISGLTIVDNTFAGSGDGPIVRLDQTAGPFKTVEQVVVDRNIASGMKLKSTVGKLAVVGANRTWTADFSDVLLFPNRINHVQYSFVVKDKPRFPALNAVKSMEGNVVVVEAGKPIDAVVSVEVDQYAMPGEKLPWSLI